MAENKFPLAEQTIRISMEAYTEILEDRGGRIIHKHGDGTVTVQLPEEYLTSKEYVPEGWENSSYYSNEQVEANIHRLKFEDIVFYKANVSMRNRDSLIMENYPAEDFPDDMFCGAPLPDENSEIYLNYQKAVEFCKKGIQTLSPDIQTNCDQKERRIPMLQSEFENLTGIYPSGNMYAVIEGFYNSSDMDKHDFCRAYLMNADCLAMKIQRQVNTLEISREHQCALRINEADVRTSEARDEVEKLQKKVEELQQELDKELDWKPAEHTGTNMKQDKYQELLNSSGDDYFSDDDAKELISKEFGFMPEKIQIIREVETYEVNKHHRLRVKDTYSRYALYMATDWNYIRFNCAGNQWEMVNGELLPYED